MRISVIHPSRGRYEQAFRTMKKWLNSAYNSTNIEYIFSLDSDDADYTGLSLAPASDRIVLRHDNKSAIEAINYAANKATGQLIIVTSDDFDCPMHWDIRLIEALQGKSDFCVKTNDGFQNTLITLPIMDRVYYERFGYIYNPAYSHMYADNELTAVALMLDKYVKLDLNFTHNHYLAGKGVKDELHIRNNATMARGREIFKERAAFNFGLTDCKPYSQIRW